MVVKRSVWKGLIGKRVRVSLGCYHHPKQVEEGVVVLVFHNLVKLQHDDGSFVWISRPSRKSDELEVLE